VKTKNDPPVWTAVDQYIAKQFIPKKETLDYVTQATDKAGLPSIAVSAPQGKWLNLLARAMGAKRILEIGTLGGYSGIWLAKALPKAGKLVTLEIDPKHAQVARANFKRAGVADRIDLKLAPALETLPTLKGPFDLVFIDADKQGYTDYFKWSLKLTRPGSLIIADNVVRNGGVVDPQTTDGMVRGIQRFNAVVAREKRATATAIQTVGIKGYDGFAVILVTG
jgi:predicted O-methyltransferase YrrM